jgi:ferredoxin
VTSNLEEPLRAKAAELLSSGKVDLLIGYGRAFLGESVRPVFLRQDADAAKLIWNDRCAHNLATYLMKEPCLGLVKGGGRVAVVAKGCDIRAIATLIQENQIERDRVHIIGMACSGVRYDEDSRDMAIKCRGCEVQLPALYDDLIGSEADTGEVEGEPREDIERILALDRSARWEFWTRELSRCIKCYACRQACPMCYCGECITEKSRPQWIDKAASLRGNIAFHYIRAMHLAGRCVACGECARACPMNIPVDLLSRFLSWRVEEAYAYRAGMDPEADPFFLVNRQDDPGEFIR